MYPCQIPSPTEDQLSPRGRTGPPEWPRPLLSVCTWEMSSARTGCFHIGHALRQFMQVWLFAGLNLIGYKVVNEAKQTFIPMGQWKIRLILAVSEPAQRSPRERRRRSRQLHRAGAPARVSEAPEGVAPCTRMPQELHLTACAQRFLPTTAQSKQKRSILPKVLLAAIRCS